MFLIKVLEFFSVLLLIFIQLGVVVVNHFLDLIIFFFLHFFQHLLLFLKGEKLVFKFVHLLFLVIFLLSIRKVILKNVLVWLLCFPLLNLTKLLLVMLSHIVSVSLADVVLPLPFPHLFPSCFLVQMLQLLFESLSLLLFECLEDLALSGVLRFDLLQLLQILLLDGALAYKGFM